MSVNKKQQHIANKSSCLFTFYNQEQIFLMLTVVQFAHHSDLVHLLMQAMVHLRFLVHSSMPTFSRNLLTKMKLNAYLEVSSLLSRSCDNKRKKRKRKQPT